MATRKSAVRLVCGFHDNKDIAAAPPHTRSNLAAPWPVRAGLHRIRRAPGLVCVETIQPIRSRRRARAVAQRSRRGGRRGASGCGGVLAYAWSKRCRRRDSRRLSECRVRPPQSAGARHRDYTRSGARLHMATPHPLQRHGLSRCGLLWLFAIRGQWTRRRRRVVVGDSAFAPITRWGRLCPAPMRLASPTCLDRGLPVKSCSRHGSGAVQVDARSRIQFWLTRNAPKNTVHSVVCAVDASRCRSRGGGVAW